MIKMANRLLFSSQLFFAAFVLIVMAGLTLAENAALSASHRQVILAGTTALCIALAFAALVLELLVRAADLERRAKELSDTAQALRESEARFLDFALTSSDWFWETDAAHRLTYASDGIRSLGLDPKSCTGRTHREIASDAASDAEKWHDHSTALARRQIFQDLVYTWKIDEKAEQ